MLSPQVEVLSSHKYFACTTVADSFAMEPAARIVQPLLLSSPWNLPPEHLFRRLLMKEAGHTLRRTDL